jgi:hypothetical protein
MVHGAKSVEGQIEFKREEMNILQANAGACRRDVAHMARKDRALPFEVHEGLS